MTSPAIAKAAQVLQVVADAREPLGFGELAARIPFARSSLHDVCTSLVQTGLLERDVEGRYSVGLRIVELGRRRLASLDIVQAFHGAVDVLDLDDTIVLAVAGGLDVVYVSFVQSSRPLAVHYEIGMRLPAAFTATGRAMLATRREAEVERQYPDAIANSNPGRPGRSRDELLAELARARERGFSIDDEETAAGMICLGAPIFVEKSATAGGAVALSLVKSGAEASLGAQADFIMGVARAISVRMGGPTGWYDRLPDATQRFAQAPTARLEADHGESPAAPGM